MSYNFSNFKIRSEEIRQWLASEFSGLRTGRATPQFLDTIIVDSYGSKMPVKHVAAVSIEDPRTLRVSPWDASQIRAIQSAIEQANLGVSVAPDSTSLHIIFPTLTEERRKMLIKLMKEKLEEARVSLRKEREKVWNEIQEKEKEGEISEDDKFKAKDELQKLVDESNKKMEEMADKKEKEILE